VGKIILESKKLSKSYSNGNKQLEVIKNLNLKDRERAKPERVFKPSEFL